MIDIEFPDAFEEDDELCTICGAEAALTGWNEEKMLSRFECAECGAIFIIDDDYNETVLKGEKRDWEKHLSEKLSFPFEARIDEQQGDDLFGARGPLSYGNKVTVIKVSGEYDMYGVIVKIKKGGKNYEFPLCDLAVDDEESANYKVLELYRDWFANCR